VRLGGIATDTERIPDAAFHRGVEAIAAFDDEIKKRGVKNILAIATSAIRESSNGERFVKHITTQFNIPIRVIDGLLEAELIYYGVRAAVKMDSSVSLIMDVGGGSTELVLANDKKVFWKQSFKIGIARLLEKFSPSDPINDKQIEAIRSYLKEELKPMYEAVKEYPPVELIGSSGAFESIVEMIHGELGGEAFLENKSEYEVSLADNHTISQMVISSTLEQRKKINGLVPMRLDMIVISCLTVNLVLDTLQLKRLRVSTNSVKEGALLDHMKTIKH